MSGPEVNKTDGDEMILPIAILPYQYSHAEAYMNASKRWINKAIICLEEGKDPEEEIEEAFASYAAMMDYVEEYYFDSGYHGPEKIRKYKNGFRFLQAPLKHLENASLENASLRKAYEAVQAVMEEVSRMKAIHMSMQTKRG